MKRIAIIGIVGLPARYGGFETLAEQLTKALYTKFKFLVYCSRKVYEKKDLSYPYAELEYISLKANGIQSILYDIVSVLKAARRTDILLILGVSGAIIIPFIKIFTKRKVILHTDGIEWRRDKWNFLAKSFLRFSEFIGVKFADVVIADNIVIQEYIRQSYNVNASLIAYGGDHVVLNDPQPVNLDVAYSKKFAFTVCRIEPENNIHVILEAFEKYDQLHLKIVGNWSNSEYARELKAKYLKSSNIELIDPIYDIKMLNKLRTSCYVYIHGHSAGGTNPSLVEAMWLNLPIVAFDVNFNRATTNNEALYFKDSDELIKVLNSLNDDMLNSVKKRMRVVASERYKWEIITQKYKSAFDSL